MKQFTKSCLLLLCAVGLTGCQTMGTNTREGAGIGAASGAVIGAALGEQNGNALPGAAIGATIGALTGGTIGNSIDQDVRARNEHAAYMQRTAITIPDVVQMSQSGLSDRVIINQVQTNGFPRKLMSEDLIFLKRNGVSDAVISALQNSNSLRSPAPFVYRERPVIVHEYWGRPGCNPPYYRGGFPRPPRRYVPQNRGRWGVSFSSGF